MASKTLRVRRAALTCAAVVLIAGPCLSFAQPANETAAGPSVAASSATQFPGLPLRRDTAEETSGLAAFGWLAVILGGFAVAVLLISRSKGLPMKIPVSNLQRLGKRVQHDAPTVTGRTSLAANVSIFTVKWGDEELLVGHTAQSLTVLARRPCVAPAEGMAHGVER